MQYTNDVDVITTVDLTPIDDTIAELKSDPVAAQILQVQPVHAVWYLRPVHVVWHLMSYS